MSLSEPELFQEHQRSDWVRLQTLATLRWVAIGGQIAAILVALWYFRLSFEVGLAAIAIGASMLVNLFLTFLYPASRRLSEREVSLTMVFDVVQLGALLAITGGLHNPFALLLLAPVTIAATVLHLRSTLALGGLALVVVTALSQWNLPVLLPTGRPLELPGLYLFGFWLALVIGLVFLSFYARRVTTEMAAMGEALVATQLALMREQKLTDLGGVVAAAAHELGTPLATIKLVSNELADELRDRPDQREDALLIRAQADRCRDILRTMGRAGKDDPHLRSAPIESVLREAAEPHLNRGKDVLFALTPEGEDARQPHILRRPEVIHGLRNLIQNAVDFAETKVEIEALWSPGRIGVRIEDDGAGFPLSVIGRIGDPFVRRRRTQEDGSRRPGYEGMGLGLFIAKTLLERTGARLTFANGGGAAAAETGEATGGAIVVVDWPRGAIAPPSATAGDEPARPRALRA